MAVHIRPLRPADLEAARQLLVAGGWTRQVGSPEAFAALIARSQIALVAEHDGEIVGFLRALTDGLANGYISMVVVAEGRRRTGIGRALVLQAVGNDPGMTWVLRAGREGVAGFYEKLGFVRSEVAMERRRDDPPPGQGSPQAPPAAPADGSPGPARQPPG